VSLVTCVRRIEASPKRCSLSMLCVRPHQRVPENAHRIPSHRHIPLYTPCIPPLSPLYSNRGGILGVYRGYRGGYGPHTGVGNVSRMARPDLELLGRALGPEQAKELTCAPHPFRLLRGVGEGSLQGGRGAPRRLSPTPRIRVCEAGWGDWRSQGMGVAPTDRRSRQASGVWVVGRGGGWLKAVARDVSALGCPPHYFSLSSCIRQSGR
jgi:hypothetical protein